jgi:hypothetical protein
MEALVKSPSLKAVASAAVMLLGAGAPLAVQASPNDALYRIGPSSTLALERIQFLYSGRNYCWYWDGWRGPGWYWCGYAFRRGFGWGGGEGWHGWAHGGRVGHGHAFAGAGMMHGGGMHGGGMHGGGFHGGGGHGGGGHGGGHGPH